MEGKFSFVCAIILCVTVIELAQGEYYSETIPVRKIPEKTTNLHFFFHDIVSGENATAVQIAKSNKTSKVGGALSFGTLSAIDDALRVGVEPNSEIIGRAKGLYLAASQEDEMALVSYMDLGFTTGKFNGSSFVVFSKNPIMETERELAVVGGRGQFRMARGLAKLYTRYFNLTSGDAIVEYNVTLFHY
ncbi:hypothetical protein JCGZ_16242 [Jatropha curcas]|uniref:Dirigent protein n=1 Tax=Jatropha curcas TaxID=180498 RepID=A0A067KFG5_JATCU|nr:dirigent protein 4 [Jatropha curcas]KDP30589.1 hypothetical protein JCGZ_16242 [Jatropha curcas]